MIKRIDWTLFCGIALVGIVLFGVQVFGQNDVFFEGENRSALECSIITNGTSVVGDDLTTTILSADYARAYARIEQPISATNTVSFGLGADAVDGTGLQIASSTITGSKQYVEIGLDTDFPYVGAVDAITNNGSSTVRVVDCRYK